MANQNGIDRNANAFKEGVEFGKKWVDYYRENGLPIEMPIFEPPKAFTLHAFQACSFNHSDICPKHKNKIWLTKTLALKRASVLKKEITT